MAFDVPEVTLPVRKPSDDEIDVYGLTHRGKVRPDNQDHFLICALRKQMVVHQTSLPDTDRLMVGPQRLAFLAMVASQPSRQYVSFSATSRSIGHTTHHCPPSQ
jgi:hypothetical protein